MGCVWLLLPMVLSVLFCILASVESISTNSTESHVNTTTTVEITTQDNITNISSSTTVTFDVTGTPTLPPLMTTEHTIDTQRRIESSTFVRPWSYPRAADTTATTRNSTLLPIPKGKLSTLLLKIGLAFCATMYMIILGLGLYRIYKTREEVRQRGSMSDDIEQLRQRLMQINNQNGTPTSTRTSRTDRTTEDDTQKSTIDNRNYM